MTTETPFLVDRKRHRIGKQDGVWKLYCPERGVDSLVLAKRFDDIVHAFTLPCREQVQVGLFKTICSHGLPNERAQ